MKIAILLLLSLCAYNIAAPVDYSPLADATDAVDDYLPPLADIPVEAVDDSPPGIYLFIYLFITE